MDKILLVEDDSGIILGLQYSIEQAGFGIKVCETAMGAMEALRQNRFDLLILDVALPDGNGFHLYQQIKGQHDIPVLFLTAKNEEDDIVRGFEAGAEDYVTKPFKTKELLLRIRKIINRRQKNQHMEYKDICIDLDAEKVYVNQHEVEFTALEYKILLRLFINHGKVMTREILLEEIWDAAGNFVNDNTLTVYIKRIRQKLERDYIKTLKGIGYRLE